MQGCEGPAWGLLPVLPFQGLLHSGGAIALGPAFQDRTDWRPCPFSASIGTAPALRAPWPAPSTQFRGLSEGMEILTGGLGS